jgi:bifunctional non-homologous end joining protein LigD
MRLTSPGRVVYASAGLTKSEVAAYYEAVTPWMLPELAKRPLSLLRCPDGADGTCFFQKHWTPGLGRTLKHLRLREKEGEDEYPYVTDAASLLQLVQMNALEFHTWGARVDAPEKPDRLIFDLDPDTGIEWKRIVAAARLIRTRLQEQGLESFVRLTGGKGLHVVAPIARGASWQRIKDFAEGFADALVAERPREFIATMSKAKRSGLVFIDWLRNSRGATAVTSWSLRAREGAPVAMPIAWEELGRARGGNAFDLRRAQKRAAALKADPWAEMHALKQRLPALRK